jgi:hypothetical protein
MLERIPARMLLEWMAFAELEPFGGDTVYIGHAITAATVSNVNRGKGKKPAKVEDFMPRFGKKTQTVEEQIQFAAMMTAAMGGQIGEDNNG